MTRAGPLLVAAACSACLVAAAQEPLPADRVLPRPLEIRAVAPPTGQVDLDPPLTWLELAAGEGAQLELTLDNGADHPVSYDLDVSPVGADPDGAPVVPPDSAPVASARDWLQLADRAVQLAPGERALVWPALTVPQGTAPGGYTAAVVARPTAGAEGRLAGLVVVEVTTDPPGAPPPAVSAQLRRTGAVTAEAVVEVVPPARHAAATQGRLQVRAWYGRTVVDVDLPTTVALAGTARSQRLRFRAPLVPGPHTVQVSLTTSAGRRLTARGTGWLWSPVATAVGAVLLGLAIVAGTALRTRRARGAG